MFDFLIELDTFTLIVFGLFFFGCDVLIYSALMRLNQKKEALK